MTLLDSGDRFSALTINLAHGETISGAIGRLVPEDVIGLVGYLREHAAAGGVA